MTPKGQSGGAPDRAPQRVASSPHGMVASAHHEATRAGVAILDHGGNAVDAAVATALALGVCEPSASGLGGQTMMLVHLAETRRTLALDGSSRAPYRAIPGTLSERDRRRGYRSTTVPSTPAALEYAVRRYGRLSWADALAPAVELADRGFHVSELLSSLMVREHRNLRDGTAAAFFLKNGSRSYRPGDLLKQPVLARTLRRLARHGVEDFYVGRIARRIHRDMIRNGGLLRADDLAQIPWPRERRPVSCTFDGVRVRSFPPPGAGRTLIEMLNILSHFDPRRRDPDTPEGAVLLAHAIRQAFLDRRDRPMHADLYRQIAEKRMVSTEYAAEVARAIRKRLRGHGETTHVSVIDRDGTAVALTQSIERVFGACVATPELGFLYNDYLSAFEYEEPSHPYFLRPHAVPWASVAPTIVFKGRRPWLVIGSPGSERIAPSIVQVLLRLDRLPLFEAVDAPRLHCSLEGEVSLEASRMRDDIPPALERHGFTIKVREPYSFYLGCVQAVQRRRREYLGVADPRRDGSAGGPSR